MDRSLVSCVIVLIVFAAVPSAQGDDDQNAPPPYSVTQPSLLLELVDPSQKPIINVAVRLKLTIINGGDVSNIQSIVLSIPQGLTLTADSRWQPDGDTVIRKESVRLRAPGERYLLPIDLVPIPWHHLG